MRAICAYCGAIVRDEPPGPSGEVSHGMCDACAEIETAKILAEYSDDDIRRDLRDAARIAATDAEWIELLRVEAARRGLEE